MVREGWNFAHVVEQFEELYQLANNVDSEAELGVVVQEHLSVNFKGDLFDEFHLSPTVNRWFYDLEKPERLRQKGFSSKEKKWPPIL